MLRHAADSDLQVLHRSPRPTSPPTCAGLRTLPPPSKTATPLSEEPHASKGRERFTAFNKRSLACLLGSESDQPELEFRWRSPARAAHRPC